MEWNLELSILVPLIFSAGAYLAGTLRLWGRAGMGHGISMAQFLRFMGAMLSLVLALLSPLDSMSESLFSAHMAQHQLLILVAAPLLASSGFSLALAWALPRRSAQALGYAFNQSRSLSMFWRLLTHPASAWFLSSVVMWIWHASALYQMALRHEALHILEHVSFLATAVLFWWVLFRQTTHRHLRYGGGVAYLFTAGLQSEVLAALITFSPEPWYADYAERVVAWALTPLQDQQLAGLIMWFPGSLVFTLLTIGYFAAWLRALELRKPAAASWVSTEPRAQAGKEGGYP
jgi:putative membrane protein